MEDLDIGDRISPKDINTVIDHPWMFHEVILSKTGNISEGMSMKAQRDLIARMAEIRDTLNELRDRERAVRAARSAGCIGLVSEVTPPPDTEQELTEGYKV